MRYNLKESDQLNAAFQYLTELSGRECMVDVKRVNPKRSLKQNAYLHLILGCFGLHFGYTMEESKAIYKEVNKSIYRYSKNGRIFWRSSIDLDSRDMTKSIDHFREKSAEQGCPLPLATDEGWLMAIQNDMERSMYI